MKTNSKSKCLGNAHSLLAVFLWIAPASARQVHGRVIGVNGKPFSGALVAVLGGAKAADYHSFMARTDAAGRFKLNNVPLGLAVFAAGGAHQFVQFKSATTDLGDVALKLLTVPRANRAEGLRIVRRLVAEQPSGDIDFDMHQIVAPVDFDMAMAMSGPKSKNGKLLPWQLYQLIHYVISQDRAAAQRLIPRMLPQLGAHGHENDYFFFAFLLESSTLLSGPRLAVVPGESANAAAMRSWVRRSFFTLSAAYTKSPAKNLVDTPLAIRYLMLAALGSRLGAGQPDRWASEGLKFEARSYAAQNNAAQRNLDISGFIRSLADGGARLFETHLGELPTAVRPDALAAAIPVVARHDVPGALRLLDLLSSTADAHLDANRAMAIRSIIGCMTPSQASQALDLARSITVDRYLPGALALAARLQPTNKATALYRQSFQLTLGEQVGGVQQAQIVDLALQTDPPVGQELLARFEENCIDPAGKQDIESKDFNELACDAPGFARVLFEAMWVHVRHSADLAAAMACTDIPQALQMASQIPPMIYSDGSKSNLERRNAEYRIAWYLVSPETIRSGVDPTDWYDEPTFALSLG